MRLALLGFQREVKVLAGKVKERREDVEALVKERKEVREKIQLGRDLLELDRRVEDLEQKLMLTPKQKDDRLGAVGEGGGDEEDIEESDEESVDEEDEEDTGVPMRRLRRLMHVYMQIRQLAEKVGTKHPFVAKQETRRAKLREALLLDMGNAMKRAVDTDERERKGQLYMIESYKVMGEAEECMKALRDAEKIKDTGSRKET